MDSQESRSFFDRSLVGLLNPTWEKAIYVLIFVIAVVSRFWDLGARAMSHDESLHALYSYYLYNGTGYQHSPMMHGPFLFHTNALIYFLFGDNDYTARIVPALFGVFVVFSPLLLRRWLGRLGTLLASIGLLISPLTLYYSRYIRNDIYIMAWTMILIAAFFYFLHDRRHRWLYVGAAVLMLSLATKEVAYIFGFIGVMFILEVILWERASPNGQRWLALGGVGVGGGLLVAGWQLGVAARKAVDQAALAAAAAGTEPAQAAGSLLKLSGGVCLVLGGTILALIISASLISSQSPRSNRIREALRGVPSRVWVIALVIMLLIYSLLFTTFFTNPSGLVTGIAGSVSYWLAQQEVERGGQPWYYYLLLLPMYEFLPMLLGFVGTVYYLLVGRKAADPEPEMPVVSEVNRSASGSERWVFIAFLIFWMLSSLFLYSWAGEKMPWLGVHPALPMIVLSGMFLGDVLSRVDWREVWRRGGALLALLAPITLFGIYTLARFRPFQGLALSKLKETSSWLLALLVTLLLLFLCVLVGRRLRIRAALLVLCVTVVVILGFFTVRSAWMASYINYDYATELLVYAHGAADVVPTMNEVANISRRIAGDKTIEVAYGDEVAWPLEWYLREYPNRKFFGDTPTERLNSPVVLYDEGHDAQVKPYLGNRYNCFKRRLVWWPNQQYMNLTWKRLGEILGSPEKRRIIWNILYWRKYPQGPENWYHVHNIFFCVKKDVAQQLWDFGAVPPVPVTEPLDPYAKVKVALASVAVWGTSGEGPGQFNHPRGLAAGPDGNIYVVDSDNARIQVFDAAGSYLRGWGSYCSLETGQGCVDPDGSGPLAVGDGQFREPWGIAVAEDGRVYVADTWNHRIQVFDSGGTFLAKWGTLGQTDAEVSLLYGPRDVAIDSTGRVLVSDTGNKRVLVYDADGYLLEQVGGGGAAPGQLDEPVGIAVDAEDNLYVADTWNQRIQIFDSDGILVRYWEVDAWLGQSITNKPFLAVDDQSRVYITDPEGYRVIVFSNDGNALAVFGESGYDVNSLSLPTGIDVDDEGYIYVADTVGQRVIKFEPLP